MQKMTGFLPLDECHGATKADYLCTGMSRELQILDWSSRSTTLTGARPDQWRLGEGGGLDGVPQDGGRGVSGGGGEDDPGAVHDGDAGVQLHL